MAINTESIIALIALLVTGTPSLLLVWRYYLQRRARRATLSAAPIPPSSPSDTVPEPRPQTSLSRNITWSAHPQTPERLLEEGLYTRRTRTDFHLSQVYISLEEVR
ncbi:hypothetical protein BJY01DRAFT_228730 [Aspergillus pseudoustus]|uniref:Uncharacterized protein n=1 Tax=Aspergillus pseudoustus TaxID=1810923 RepID=A0ABR4IK06_9EURO